MGGWRLAKVVDGYYTRPR